MFVAQERRALSVLKAVIVDNKGVAREIIQDPKKGTGVVPPTLLAHLSLVVAEGRQWRFCGAVTYLMSFEAARAQSGQARDREELRRFDIRRRRTSDE